MHVYYLGPESEAGHRHDLIQKPCLLLQNLSGNFPQKAELSFPWPISLSVLITYPLHSRPSFCICTLFLPGYFLVTLQVTIYINALCLVR